MIIYLKIKITPKFVEQLCKLFYIGGGILLFISNM